MQNHLGSSKFIKMLKERVYAFGSAETHATKLCNKLEEKYLSAYFFTYNPRVLAC